MSSSYVVPPPVNNPNHPKPETTLRRARVLAKSNGRCWYCGVVLDPIHAHVDHQVARVRGGRGGDNLVAACKRCNCTKGVKTVDEFRLLLQRRAAGEPSFSYEQRRWLADQGFEFPTNFDPIIFYGETL
jgi:5-methylcytosine-specific restriction endonuclease McrA